MPTTVVVNGAFIRPGTEGKAQLVVDATVGSNHHQGVFDAERVLRLPTDLARRTYIAQQMTAVDAVATATTTAPGTFAGIIGTVTV